MWIKTPSGVTAHVNTGGKHITDPKTMEAIIAVVDAAHDMLKENNDETAS